MEKKRILFVDDDDSLRGTLSMVLESDGYLVDEAQNGLEALDKVLLNPDLVLTDIDMPQLNGVELLKILKKKNQNAKIAFLTASSDEKYKLKILAEDIDCLLTKPIVDVDSFSLKIKELLN